MTLDNDDVEAIAASIVAKLQPESDTVKSDVACRILGVGRRALRIIAGKYPEIQPSGKGSHWFSRAACVRVARIRKATV